MEYGGFWIRVVAYIIDGVILALVTVPLAFLLGDSPFDPEASTGISDVLNLVVGIAYFVGFEGSAKQATPGKMVFGLIVTDEQGGRISHMRALGRYFAKILSAIILMIGFIMVAFTEKKQGLHDLLASTFVVHGEPGMVGWDEDVFA